LNPKSPKLRLDQLLVDRGLAETRTRAQALLRFVVHFEKVAKNLTRDIVTVNIRTAILALLFIATLLFVDHSKTFIYFRF
jgi:hypothetical protein